MPLNPRAAVNHVFSSLFSKQESQASAVLERDLEEKSEKARPLRTKGIGYNQKQRLLMSILMYESRLNVSIIKNEIKMKTYSLLSVSFWARNRTLTRFLLWAFGLGTNLQPNLILK